MNPYLSAASLILLMKCIRSYNRSYIQAHSVEGNEPHFSAFSRAMTSFLIYTNKKRVLVVWKRLLQSSGMLEGMQGNDAIVIYTIVFNDVSLSNKGREALTVCSEKHQWRKCHILGYIM